MENRTSRNPEGRDGDTPTVNPSSELIEYYRDGLAHVVDGNDQLAVIPLMDAWDFHNRVDGRGKQLAYGAGVALAVLVTNDVGLSSLREEVLDTIEDPNELPDVARSVFDATTGGTPDRTPEGLREGVPEETSELDEIEMRAFARLLGEALD
ncbi:hypothetical protein C5C07_19130 [Haloferax sp. Atlit-4N]|nr:hypothetical protein C5C07_19130 [Haloferax sp. Atlit-4N]